MKKQNETSQPTLSAYLAGFICSLILTLVAYSLVARHVNSGGHVYNINLLTIAIAGLAITQLLVQLVFFLHLSRESKPRWNFTVLLFAGLVVFIVVAGSLWIMQNLGYHHPDNNPEATDKYIIQDEGYNQ
jgi:cytochrome o ubiquinol oxidase operon protein cyoD